MLPKIADMGADRQSRREHGQRCMQEYWIAKLFLTHTFKYELMAGPLRRPRRLPSSSLRSSVSETTGSES